MSHSAISIHIQTHGQTKIHTYFGPFSQPFFEYLCITLYFSDMSTLGILSKAERTGNSISKYGFGREVGCPYFWSPWVDDLYSPDWHIKVNTRYPWKDRFQF